MRNNDVINFYITLDKLWKELYDLRIKAHLGDLSREEVKLQARELNNKFDQSFILAEPFLDEYKKNDKSFIIFKKLVGSLIGDEQSKSTEKNDENTLTF